MSPRRATSRGQELPDDNQLLGAAQRRVTGLATSATVEIRADGAPAGLFTIETVEEWGIGAWEPNKFVQVQVARNYYSDGAVSVTLIPESASAVAGEDFAPDGVTVSWADGEVGVKEVQLPIKNDAEEEGSEEFTVKLTNATAGAIGARSTALIRIDDDDRPEEPPLVNSGTSGGGGHTGLLSMMLMLCLGIVRRRCSGQATTSTHQDVLGAPSAPWRSWSPLPDSDSRPT